MTDQDSTPLSMADAVRALSQDDRVANPEQDNREHEREAVPQEGDDEQELVDTLATEEEGDTPDEEADEGPSEDEEQQPYDKGRFASDDAKVTLDDGRVTTIADLKKGSMLQSDYSKKTAAIAEERKAIEQYKADVRNRENTLKQHGEIVAAVVQEFLPTMPDQALLDPQSGQFDMVSYMAKKADYEQKSQVVQQLINNHQALTARQAAEAEQARLQVRAQEADRLFEKRPELKNPEKYQRFWARAVDYVGSIGYTPEELDQVDDHRTYLVLEEAMKYRDLQARVGQAKTKISGKPNVLSGQTRRSPDLVRSQDAKAAMARLNKSGSVQDGIAAMIALEKRSNR